MNTKIISLKYPHYNQRFTHASDYVMEEGGGAGDLDLIKG